MRLKNEVYDILKDTSTIYLPALASLWLTLAGIWNLPYGAATPATPLWKTNTKIKSSTMFKREEKIR